MKFGEFIKQKRLEMNISLRNFTELIGYDPSNWSKIERGILPPPPYNNEDINLYQRIGKVLNLTGDEFNELITFASVDRKEIPNYIDDSVLDALPIFFRTANREKLSREKLEKLIQILKSRWYGIKIIAFIWFWNN